MKRFILSIAALFSFAGAIAQTNIFPDTGKVGIKTLAPTHSLTFGSTSTGIALYKTTEQVTNYERVIAQWQGNTYTIGSYLGGNGTLARSIQIGIQPAVGTTILSTGRVFTINAVSGITAGVFDFLNTTGLPGSVVTVNANISGNAVQQNMVAIQGTVNQTSGTSSGYKVLFISPYIQGTGSGSKYLIDAGTNSAAAGTGTHTSKFVLTQGGNVGIGTANPVSALTLGGTGNANPNTGTEVDYAGENLTFLSQATGQAFTLGSIKMVQPNGTYIDRGDMVFSLGTGSGAIAERMRINAFGNVGIGTNNPTAPLSVNGTIRSKEVKVEAGPWPDYVFAKSYLLPSLNEIKTYIDKNHHLPGMPSAAEVEKDGLSLGAMNKLLTQKVEELTLYLIEKDKQMKAQVGINNSLQKQINALAKQWKLRPARKTSR